MGLKTLLKNATKKPKVDIIMNFEKTIYALLTDNKNLEFVKYPEKESALLNRHSLDCYYHRKAKTENGVFRKLVQ